MKRKPRESEYKEIVKILRDNEYIVSFDWHGVMMIDDKGNFRGDGE